MWLPDETLLAKYVIKTHYIVKVVAVHPETQTVDVVEDVYRFVNSATPFTKVFNEVGNAVDVALAKKRKLLNIPVKQERWGQFKIQCNPAVGDTGYIEIMTNDIRDWMLNGSDSVPWTDDHFDERSCVFVPFVQNATNKQDDYPADNTQLVIKSPKTSITLTDDGESSKIDIEADQVNIGSKTATEWAVLGNKLESLLQNMMLQFNTHTHTGNLGVPTSPSVTQMTYSDIKSETVKVA